MFRKNTIHKATSTVNANLNLCSRSFKWQNIKHYKTNKTVLSSFDITIFNYVSWLFEVVFVTAALCTANLESSGQEFFDDSYILCYLEFILLFCAAIVIIGKCLFHISLYRTNRKRIQD